MTNALSPVSPLHGTDKGLLLRLAANLIEDNGTTGLHFIGLEGATVQLDQIDGTIQINSRQGIVLRLRPE